MLQSSLVLVAFLLPQDVAEKHPATKVPGLADRCRALEADGQYEESKRVARDLLGPLLDEKSKLGPLVYRRVVHALLKVDRGEEALWVTRVAHERWPRASEFLQLRGASYLTLAYDAASEPETKENYRAAIGCFLKAIRAGPRTVAMYEGLAEARLGLGLSRAALTTLGEALEFEDCDVGSIQYQRGALLMTLGEYADATTALTASRAQEGEDAYWATILQLRCRWLTPSKRASSVKEALSIVREKVGPDWVLLRLAAIDILAMAAKVEFEGAPSLTETLAYLALPPPVKGATESQAMQYTRSAHACAQTVLRHVEDDARLRAKLMDDLGIAARMRAARDDGWTKSMMRKLGIGADQADLLNDVVLSLAPQFGSLVSEKADDWRYQIAFAFSYVRVLEYRSKNKKDMFAVFGSGRFRDGQLAALRELQNAPEDPQCPLGFHYQRVADRLLARLGEPGGLEKRRRDAKAARAGK